jgi:uncharacterized repeat protein (TIGR01451 family)
MFEKNARRWSSLVLGVTFLAVCALLAWGAQASSAGDAPSAPISPYPAGNAPYQPQVNNPPRSEGSDLRSPAPDGGAPALLSSLQAGVSADELRFPGLPPADLVTTQSGSPAALQNLNPGFTVDLAYNAVWGLVSAGDEIILERVVGGDAYGAAEADGTGFFWTPLWQADGRPADIAGGDEIEVYVNGSLAATLEPMDVTGSIDVLADQVAGTIAGDTGGTEVTLAAGLEGQFPAGAPQQTVITGGGGSFAADFGSMNLGAGTLVAVEYPMGDHTVRTYLYPEDRVFQIQNLMRVQGYADVGQQVDVVVYEGAGPDVRWSGGAAASWPHGWYDVWAPGIQPGDLVEVDLGGGTVLDTTAADLSVTGVDPATDGVEGTAPPGALVAIALWQAAGYVQSTAGAGPAGDFSAALPADLRPRDEIRVSVSDAEGDESQLVSGAPHIDALIETRSGMGCISWRVDGPDLPVTLTVETGWGTFTRTGITSGAGNGSYPYCHVIRDDEGTPLPFPAGSIVTVESPTWQGTVIVADISWEVDTSAEEVSGSAPPGEVQVTARQWFSDQYPAHGAAVETTVAAPGYAVTFSGFDLRDGGSIEVGHYDPDTDFSTHANFWSNVATHYFQATVYGVVEGMPPSPDEPVTAHLYEADGTTLLASTDNDEDGDPWRFQLRFDNQAIEPGNWVTVEAESGWTASLKIPALTVQADTGTDLIWGQGPKSLLFVEHNWFDGWSGHFVPVDDYALDAGFFGGDINKGDTVSASYQAVNGNRARAEARLGEVLRAEFWLNSDGSTWMWGEAQPGSSVTVTTPLTQVVTIADPSCNGCWDLNAGLVYPGDVVTVSASPGEDPVAIAIPSPFTAQADSELNQVWGQIGGWPEGDWIQVHGQWEDGYREVQAGAGGSYLATYGDVPRGPQGYVRAERLQGYTWVVFHRPLTSGDLVLNVNYGHDWVEGTYDPGYTVWLTVTDAVGIVKATAELQSQVIPWWGGQSGFSTNLDEPWVPARPDIQVGDRVYGRVNRDEGYTGSVRVGTINGALDLDADTVSGTILAPWFSETLNGNCGVWEENGPGEGFEVDPNGGSYSCDFGAMGWDLQPGHDVGVQYQEPDGDWVLNVFRTPAPNLHLDKWAAGSAQAAPGGAAIFELRVYNHGDAPAEAMELTDTLPPGTTYVTDSSGVVPVLGPGTVTWNLTEPLNPGQSRQFQLVLEHSGSPGDTLHNVAEVATLYDEDPWNNHAEADIQVVDGQPDLYASKNPNPGDPTPGQTMLWEINYGNNGPVASGPVELRDTVPAGTSIVGWESENGYLLWTDHSTAGELILRAPSVPGHWGDRILLRLLLDSDLEMGTQLTNVVEISTADDANPDDNQHLRDDVWVSGPRWNGHVNKNLGWGRLVPGGEAGYNIHVRNNGNMATVAVMEDVLPYGTTFVEAWQWTPTGDVPFPPDSVTGGVLTWNLGLMEPGQWYNLNIRVALDGGLAPGTVLNNCVSLTVDGEDQWPYDNSDCVVESVHAPGPNLRVVKEFQWNWEGQLQYNVNFYNLGTTTLNDVALADTLPSGTSFNGNWWHWFWEGIDLAPAGEQLVWTMSHLEPGWSSGLSFQVDLDQALVGEQGLSYTNLVAAPIAGDVYPADNSSQVTAYTGPDVYVQKWLKAGEVRTGQTITYTVEFGNLSFWPWDTDPHSGSHIVDTLPAGLTFVRATAPWNPNETWDPEEIAGNSVTWGWGPMWSNSWWQFDIVAKVTGPVTAGQVLVNTVEAYSDGPNDVEPDYDNNVFELPVLVEGSRLYLPIVVRK